MTADHETWTVPQNGFAADGEGDVSPETLPLTLPSPVAVQ